MEMVKIYLFSHPNWDMKLLVTEADGGKSVGPEMLSEDDDPELLVMEEIEMSREELEKVHEWDG